MSDRQMCRTCFCLGYDLVPVNGEWSCMEHLNGRDAAAEIVRLNEQLAERTLQHQVQLDNAVDLTARLAAAESDIGRLNQMLRETGYGHGQIDSYAAECEEHDRCKEKLAAAEAAARFYARYYDGPAEALLGEEDRRAFMWIEENGGEP